MDVSNLLSYDIPQQARTRQGIESMPQEQQRLHQYPTRHSVLNNNNPNPDPRFHHAQNQPSYSSHTPNVQSSYDILPMVASPKNVSFELLFEGAPNYRARLPMRVQIFPHDTTDSIVTTVKNFYGLYEGAAKGVSFEDDQGNTLIARYENFKNTMTVYVRVIPDYSQPSPSHGRMVYHSASPISAHRTPHLDEPLQMLPPQQAQMNGYGPLISRPGSRVARKRSVSPRPSRNQRSASAQKQRSQSAIKSRGSSVHGSHEEFNNDGLNGYSSSEGGAGSVTSSFKARSEQLASAEISLDNILEGNRRKRAKFESSELPLFVPPQVPAPHSVSSISPQRRSNGQENFSPFARPTQRSFVYSQPLQSPQQSGHSENAYGPAPQATSTAVVNPSVQHGHRLRGRVNAPYTATRISTGSVPRRAQGPGILPTPDPTVASCISDEDVALQLMRLGDASNISHGRTSASTLDDALSGRADVASSVTSESCDESDATEQPSLPSHRIQTKAESSPALLQGSNKKRNLHLQDILPSFDSTEPSGDEVDGDYEYDVKRDGIFRSDPDDMVNEFGHAIKSKQSGPRSANGGVKKSRSVSASHKASKSSKQKPAGLGKARKPSSLSTGIKPPISPASLPPESRKTSSASTLNFQHQLGVDEEDLSSKPRCQRCRKSKKGCDRQRPCQRCKDAGIGVDGCVSEDEGNGRKGRFGRHMGVPVKKDGQDFVPEDEHDAVGSILTATASRQDSPEKSKKRKR